MWEVSTGGMVASVVWGIWLASVLEYFNVSWEVLIILSVMLALDYIFWIADAYIDENTQVTSAKMWRGLFKKMTRRMLPLIVVAILRWVWAWDLEFVSTVIFSMLIITEWYSIIGHIYSINEWEKLPEIDAFKALVQFIANLLKGKLPDLNKEEEDEQMK